MIPHQKFDGAMEKLKGHVFDLISANSADLCIKTKKELSTDISACRGHNRNLAIGDFLVLWKLCQLPSMTENNVTNFI